jgi:hypothetical protein
MQAVHVDAPDANQGTIVSVRIDAAHANSLGGTVAVDGQGDAAARQACPPHGSGRRVA